MPKPSPPGGAPGGYAICGGPPRARAASGGRHGVRDGMRQRVGRAARALARRVGPHGMALSSVCGRFCAWRRTCTGGRCAAGRDGMGSPSTAILRGSFPLPPRP
jgi:hypothetical protein